MKGILVLWGYLIWIKIVAISRINLGSTNIFVMDARLHNEGVADCLLQKWLTWSEVDRLHSREGDT
jgi:hypothetical protein